MSESSLAALVNAGNEALHTLNERAKADTESMVAKTAAKREILTQISEITDALRKNPELVTPTWRWLDLQIKKLKLEFARAAVEQLQGQTNGSVND